MALSALAAIAALALAQSPAKPEPSASGIETSLPSRATADSFMRHMFGYEPNAAWTITSIKPSDAPGIAEIDLTMKSAQNNGERKLFVLAGHKQVILGDMVPFPGDAARPSDMAINSFVRQMTGGTNPAITWTIGEVKPHAVSDLTQVMVMVNTPKGRWPVAFLVTADGKHTLMGELFPFAADPFAANRAKLQKGINGPSRGPANAAVTIVEFADLQCPACKAALPVVQKLLADAPNARFVFQQFPLTQMHHWAFAAAEYGECVHRENPAAFWKFVDAVYGAQEQITADTNNSEDAGKKAEAKLQELAAAAGVDGQKVAACAHQPATAERVKQSVALGKELEITGTPTLFIGGRRISNLGQLPPGQLKKMAEFTAKGK
ncbi:MAG: thioredoxin domain-containing protein [Terriglobales bacterium]